MSNSLQVHTSSHIRLIVEEICAWNQSFCWRSSTKMWHWLIPSQWVWIIEHNLIIIVRQCCHTVEIFSCVTHAWSYLQTLNQALFRKIHFYCRALQIMGTSISSSMWFKYMKWNIIEIVRFNCDPLRTFDSDRFAQCHLQ